MQPKIKIFGLITVLAAIGIVTLSFGGLFSESQETSRPAMNVPSFSANAEQGKALFDANCARCHGVNAAGSNNGPPLVHKIYEPNHHSDIAFVLAATRGVRAHHWQFGNMPALPNVDENDVTQIVAYVRELQRANGIF